MMTPGPDRILLRAVIVSSCLLAGALVVARTSKAEIVPLREPFATFPMHLGQWEGESADRFDQKVLTVLGVDEYINRVYARPDGATIGLYIGFYGSQRQGDTMHSPLNCLPGAGWQPTTREHAELMVATPPGATAPNRTISVNRIVIQKGLDRQVVLYWYQSHGRVIASEYWGKIYTVVDAIRLNRTDAAMIRIISPVMGTDDASVAAAAGIANQFAEALFPLLPRYLPE